MFYDLKADRIDRCANKSKHSTNVAPKAACGLILLATRMLYKGRHRISIPFSAFLAFSCGRAKTIQYATCRRVVFMKSERKISVFKNIRIRVDRALNRTCSLTKPILKCARS